MNKRTHRKTSLLPPVSTPARSKALLAIAFAGGILYPQLPALCENKLGYTDSTIKQSANGEQLFPLARAYDLLRLASGYLRGVDRTFLESSFRADVIQSSTNRILKNSRREEFLADWATAIALQECYRTWKTKSEAHTGSDSASNPAENFALVDATIQSALIQLDKAPGTFTKFHMYFIASRLFHETGNKEGMRNCDAILDKLFRSCEEEAAPIDEERIKTASSILNLMAYRYIPLNIDASRLQNQTVLSSFTENDFQESNKLKQRAVAMVDRLDAKNQLRRRAHRDLALWYQQLGQPVLALKEKLILFDLVGIKDDRILYPQAGVCGQLVWWQTEQRQDFMQCGMG